MKSQRREISCEISRRKADAPPGTSWCPRHDDGAGAWVPREEFGKYGETGVQRYCRACRSAYLKTWRATGKPAKAQAALETIETLSATDRYLLERYGKTK